MSESILAFFSKVIFPINMFASGAIYVIHLKKRKHFGLSAIIGLVVCIIVSFLLDYSVYNFLILFVFLTIVCYYICDIKIKDALFVTACAYITQHFAYCLYSFVYRVYPLPNLSIEYFICSLITFIVFYLLFAKKLLCKGQYNINIGYALVSTCIALIITLFLSYKAQDINSLEQNSMYHLCNTYAMLCCIIMLWLQVGHQEQLRIQARLNFQQALRQEHIKQYERTRENVDSIAKLCHNLKYHVEALKRFGALNEKEKYYQKIEEAILAYDIDVHTGNDILDIVIVEKKFQCLSQNINFTCVADGKQLDFMNEIDIYTIFGNALDNAIESVINVDDNNRKLISVSLWSQKGLLIINIENYYEHHLIEDDNLLKTTKSDAELHGYGLKSIDEIIKKYDGVMNISTHNQMFILQIAIPLT